MQSNLAEHLLRIIAGMCGRAHLLALLDWLFWVNIFGVFLLAQKEPVQKKSVQKELVQKN